MNLLDDNFSWLSREDLLEHVASRDCQAKTREPTIGLRGDILGQVAVLSPLHIETFDLHAGRAVLFDLDSCILLLLQKQHALEDVVNVDFEQTVSLVDELLELVADLKSSCHFGNVGVDHDRIGITIDDLLRIESA